MEHDLMNRLCVKLDDSTNLLKVDTDAYIYTITLYRHCCNYIISKTFKRQRRRAAQCTYMASATCVRRINCIQMFKLASCTREGDLNVLKALHMCISRSTCTRDQTYAFSQAVKNLFSHCTCRDQTLNLQATNILA